MPKYLLTLFLLVGCTDHMHNRDVENYANRTFSSNGERLYFTGVSNSGKVITFTGGHHHTRMHASSCVTCHGENREGGLIMWPWFWVMSSPLTKQYLLGQHDDGHSHDGYNFNSLKLAITEGTLPSGKALHSVMPRVSLGDEDMHDLIEFLIGHPDDHSH